MAKYVDGFVFVVPKSKLSEYKKMAKEGARIWRKYGALDYKECMGEDLVPKSMGGQKPRAFTEMANAKKGDTVWFSYIVFKSRKHRDSVNAKVMKEMSKKMEKEENKDFSMPFEMDRFAYGGFEVIVE